MENSLKNYLKNLKYISWYIYFNMSENKKPQIFLEIFFQISVIFENSIRTRMTVTLAVTVTVTVKIFAAKLTETIANIYKDLGKI